MSEQIVDIAQKLIDVAEGIGPYGCLEWQEAEPLILALGGNPIVSQCDHSATLCIYIAALMVRNQEKKNEH